MKAFVDGPEVKYPRPSKIEVDGWSCEISTHRHLQYDVAKRCLNRKAKVARRTEAETLAIVKAYAAGETGRAIGERIGRSATVVYRIVWSWIFDTRKARLGMPPWPKDKVGNALPDCEVAADLKEKWHQIFVSDLNLREQARVELAQNAEARA